MSNNSTIIVRVATDEDLHFATIIADEMASSAAARGTGIARRSPEYLKQKMLEGKAVIAHTKEGTWVGFCYIEAWGHGKYVANSGLIVSPDFRGSGVARRIKERIFELSRKKFPGSKIFGLTTGLAVMKINSELGYEPVTYSELTDDQEFWKGCQTCVNYDILMAKQQKNCLCTGMLFDPEWEKKKKKSSRLGRTFKGNFKLFERWTRLKKRIFLRTEAEKQDTNETKTKKNTFLSFWSLFI
jgi:N-acetylglutamate synthase-like GNAT family acetyltransferase